MGLLASGFAGAFPASIRFLMAVSVLSWITGGVLLTRFLILPLEGRSLRISLYFMTGLSLVSIVTWLATVLGVPFDRFAVGLQWGLVLFYAASMVYDWRRGPSSGAGTKRALGADGVYIAVAIVLAVVTAINPPRLDYHQDAFDHIGYVRRVDVENSLTPSGVLAMPTDAAATGIKADPRKGTFHAVTATAVRMAGVDPVFALPVLAVFLFPLAFLNFVLFCTPFLPRRWLVAACAALFLLFQGGIGFEYANAAAYGYSVSLLFYWILVVLSFKYFESSNRNTLTVVLLIFAGGAFIHAGVVLHFLILLGTVFIFRRLLALPARPVLTLCLWGIVAAAVAAAWKIVVSYGEGNVIHIHPQGLLYLGKGQFVFSPVEILRQHGLVFLGGVFITPLLIFGARRSEHARRIMAFAVIPFVVCFTPFLTPLIFKGATYMTFRSLANVPVYAAVVLVFWGLAVWARRGGVAKRTVSAAVLIAWSWTFLSPSLGALCAAAARARESAGAESISSRYGDLLEFLGDLPKDSVVLSDPLTSYWISAASDLRVVAVLGQHGNPNDEYAMDRLKATKDMLSPFTIRSLALAARDRYGVDYVVLNGRLTYDKNEFLVNWNPALFKQTKAKLSSLRSRFRTVFESQDIVVYRSQARPMVDDQWGPEYLPVRLKTKNGGLSPCRVKAPGGVFEIRSAGISPGRVLPGETVLLTIGYDKGDRSSYWLPMIIHIRFDHESITSASSGVPGEKYIRRYRDRREGHFSRYRYDHHPFDGLYTPDQWPIGRPFYEVVAVKLPPTLRKGEYTVELNIVTEALLPNFTVRDFLFDRDHYSGVPCLTLEVTDYTIR